MSDEDYAQIRAAFKSFDVDNSGRLSIDEMRAILSRGPSPMLSPEEVDEVILEFDANGDGVLDIHEFTKACFALSDEEAELLQAKLEETEARRAAGAKLTEAGLKHELQQLAAAGEEIAMGSSETVLKLLQWQLLSLLTDANRDAIFSSDAGKSLFADRERLECLLSAGECNVSGGGSPKTAAERWAAAARVLCQILEHDPRRTSSLSVRFRVAVAVALCYGGDGKTGAVERYDTFCGWHEAGELYDTFGELTAWQMRYVVGAWVTHEEMEWARANLPDDFKSRDTVGEATHKMVAYRRHNAQGVSIFAGQVGDKDNMPGAPSGVGYYHPHSPVTMAVMAEVGAVCGGISKFGVAMCQAHGVPAMPVAQPGHCAFLWQKASGAWVISNNISGWPGSSRHSGIQMTWGGSAWVVPLMEHAQRSYANFCESERWLRESWLAPISVRGDLLDAASRACPTNLAVWAARAQYLADAHDAGHNVTSDAWVGRTREELQAFIESKEKVDWLGNLGRCKPVAVSDNEGAAHCMVDGGDHWHSTLEGGAWVEIDLEQACQIQSVDIHWWGCSVASTFVILSSDGEEGFVPRLSRNDAKYHPGAGQYNGMTGLDGWPQTTSKVRVELSDGQLDPLGQGAYFGIREISIWGSPLLQLSEMSPSKLLKLVVSRALDKETVDAETSSTAADAGDRMPANTTVLSLAVDHVHDLIERHSAVERSKSLTPIEEYGIVEDYPREDCD